MKYFVILLVLIGFTGITFAEGLTPPHDPYTDDERLRIASEKKIWQKKIWVVVQVWDFLMNQILCKIQ